MADMTNPHAEWLRKLATAISDVLSPSERQRMEHCANELERLSANQPLLSDRADELIRELHRQGMMEMRSVFDGAILTIARDKPAPEPSGEIGDSIACITYALERPADIEEWARLLRDSRAVIERLDDALTEAKRQRNDEQRLRRAAEKAAVPPRDAPETQASPQCRTCGDTHYVFDFTSNSNVPCPACSGGVHLGNIAGLAAGTYQCPLCGNAGMHQHTSEEIAIYRGARFESQKMTKDRLSELRDRAAGWRSGDGLSEDMLAEVALWAADKIERLRGALDEAGKLADWINRARPVVTELMRAYERRIRSDCTLETLAKKPWRCMEYIAAEDLLRDQPVAVVEIT